MDSIKKLPTWGRGCQKSGKFADVVYGWSLTRVSYHTWHFSVSFIASSNVSNTKFLCFEKRPGCHYFFKLWRHQKSKQRTILFGFFVFSHWLMQWKKHKFTQSRLPRNTQTTNWHPLMCTYQDEKPLLFVLLLRFGLAFFYKFWNLILRACVDVTYGTEIFVKKHRSPRSWR